MSTTTPDEPGPVRVRITADVSGYVEQIERMQERASKAAEAMSFELQAPDPAEEDGDRA